MPAIDHAIKRQYYRVVPDKDAPPDKRWNVQKDAPENEGERGHLTTGFRYQQEAIEWARTQAMNLLSDFGWRSGVRICRPDGTIRAEWSYGEDPRDIPG